MSPHEKNLLSNLRDQVNKMGKTLNKMAGVINIQNRDIKILKQQNKAIAHRLGVGPSKQTANEHIDLFKEFFKGGS